MHAHVAHDPELLERAREAHLLHYDADFYRVWPRRAWAFACWDEWKQPEDARHAIAWLVQRYDQVVDRLVALPQTFIHGEFFASNVLIQSTAAGHRVCPIDWEMAAVGPALIDVAALTAGGWTAQQRGDLALAYRSGRSE